jgi:UDP-N-acetylmuramoyl-tripeptide--D-alanyl-D-alanine ligase
MNAPLDIGLGLERVLDATSGALVRPGAERFTRVVIDGRDVPRGALFFAVKGERFDGHDFVAQAVAGGADGVVVARGRGARAAESAVGSFAVIEVDDTVLALGQLARAHREAMSELKVVGVAGSNGKTTTKEITAAILSAAVGEGAVLKTEGNLNNHLGVPLTLLKLTPAHRFAVVEMGMSALGELAYLASIARPDVAIIVSIAVEHLEHLGTIENIARAEAEILDAVTETGTARGYAVVPVDEPLLAPYVERVPAARRLTFGPRASGATVGIENVTPGPDGLTFTLHLRGLTSRSGVQAKLPLVGAHNASNAAAAAAAALALDLGEGPILDGLEHVKPAKHRAQLYAVGDRTVLDDCYNASPLSMRAALDALTAAAPAGRKRVAVLGDMLELGPEGPALHAEIGAYAAARVDELIAFGPLSRGLAEAARAELPADKKDRVLHTDDPHDAAERALAVSGTGDVILIKASRGMRLERVIDLIAQALAERRA